jgi:thiol-disulfide isomerase/thioredoxin
MKFSFLTKYFLLCFHLFYVAVSKIQDVTSKNFDSFIKQSEVKLLEFYSPWCRHCVQFENPYTNIAKTLKGDDILVGKCDSSTNQALAARFNIHHIPSIYLIRERKVWIYSGSLSHDNVVNFVSKGYKNQSPLSLFESPLGPIGITKGILIKIGIYIYSLPKEISEKLGISDILSLIILVITAIVIFILSLLFIVFLKLKKNKNE